MKTLLLLCVLLPALPVAAQIPGSSVPTYVTKLGTTFHKGDTLHLTMGKADNGSYRYAYLPPNGFIGSPQKQLTSSWNNLNPVIKDIRSQKTVRNMSPRTVAVIGTGGINACVDLESAEEVGEIRTVNNQKKATPASVGGVADELIKLKGLLDAGVLTQAEFDAQKAKLLTP